MAQYISKDALVAEIERLKDKEVGIGLNAYEMGEENGKFEMCNKFLSFLDTLEVKEVDENFECPTIKVEDAIEVTSRMQYIDNELMPIAKFVMGYASWNLHKDEWSQPTIEVPLFRVLDALAQRGKPYCAG